MIIGERLMPDKCLLSTFRRLPLCGYRRRDPNSQNGPLSICREKVGAYV
jgi:hypothetical protein